MRKVDRLFEIIQLLRGKRLRTAQFIADSLDVSIRTVYRDIQGLIASGVPIEGERGIGYMIQQPIEMPPLHFTPLELQAMQLGINMVKAVADHEIVAAAEEASIKIQEALPKSIQTNVDPIVRVYFKSNEETRETLLQLRKALDESYKIELDYETEQKEQSIRIVRPLGIEYWGKVWTLSTWCELRDDFRMFRIDRIKNCIVSEEKFAPEAGKTYQDYINQYTCEKS